MEDQDGILQHSGRRIMRALLSSMATLLVAAGMGAGCGDDGGSGPESPVLTTLEVTPPTATLFTVAPGNTIALSVVALDQRGETMTGVGSPSFASDDGEVATVSGDGTVAAVAAGTATITASLTVEGVTETATTAVTVEVAPAAAEVLAPQLQYQPKELDVSAGGVVTWRFASTPHTVTFTTTGAPADVPELQNGSTSRIFPDNGTFDYRCSLHSGMTGSIRVH